MGDLDELVDFIDLFQKETGIDQNDRDGYRRDGEAFIRAGTTFFWQNEQGEHVASCKYAADGTMASLNLVFTRPAFRRKHYAENLVYQVTKLAMEGDMFPCFIQTRIMPRPMPVTRKSDMFSEASCVQ